MNFNKIKGYEYIMQRSAPLPSANKPILVISNSDHIIMPFFLNLIGQTL